MNSAVSADILDLIVNMCRVELLSFFLFHLSYFCLFRLLVLPYVVNKVESIYYKLKMRNRHGIIMEEENCSGT